MRGLPRPETYLAGCLFPFPDLVGGMVMSHRRFQFRPQLEAFEDRLCPSSTTVLPISAFLAQQGHDHVFTPPVQDQKAWSNSTFDPGATPATHDPLTPGGLRGPGGPVPASARH